jgi:ubiquinone/menaquinone biosynthesis C-methylase UbiE
LRFLNVGGGSKDILIPPHYQGWEHVLLDVDAGRSPDVVCDARELTRLPAATYDAVYCSHNLEHYWRHDLPRVLEGFLHVLKDDGFAEVAVPDLRLVFEEVLKRNLGPDDPLYLSQHGPITVNDVIYGWGREIEASGHDYYAHKNGFTATSLVETLRRAGFRTVYRAAGPFEARALAFKGEPGAAQRALLGLPASG